MSTFQPNQIKEDQQPQTLVQPSLEIGEEDDEQEKEANSVADKVMRMSSGGGDDSGTMNPGQRSRQMTEAGTVSPKRMHTGIPAIHKMSMTGTKIQREPAKSETYTLPSSYNPDKDFIILYQNGKKVEEIAGLGEWVCTTKGSVVIWMKTGEGVLTQLETKSLDAGSKLVFKTSTGKTANTPGYYKDIEKNAGKNTIYVASGIDEQTNSDSRFAQWAKASGENAEYSFMKGTVPHKAGQEVVSPVKVKGPPSMSTDSSMNCWEMIMLAMYNAGSLKWADLHKLYTSSSRGAGWENEVIALMTKGKKAHNYKYELTKTGVPADAPEAARVVLPAKDQDPPRKGAIVFIGDEDSALEHVAVATGEQTAAGSYTYSFYPMPPLPSYQNTILPIDKQLIETFVMKFRLRKQSGGFVTKNVKVTYYQ